MGAKFRFQDLKIWQLAIEITDDLLDIADELEKKLFRFADQLRGASMSMSNNIAEGSGSTSKTDFNKYLNYARRSTFENANILILLNRRNLFANEKLDQLSDKFGKECRMITNKKNTIIKRYAQCAMLLNGDYND